MAYIYINEQKIGKVVDQFLRYDFEIEDSVLHRGLLCPGDVRRHNLTISFFTPKLQFASISGYPLRNTVDSVSGQAKQHSVLE